MEDLSASDRCASTLPLFESHKLFLLGEVSAPVEGSQSRVITLIYAGWVPQGADPIAGDLALQARVPDTLVIA